MTDKQVIWLCRAIIGSALLIVGALFLIGHMDLQWPVFSWLIGLGVFFFDTIVRLLKDDNKNSEENTNEPN